MRKSLIWLWIACSPLQAADDTFAELFADPATRVSALPQLVPGSRDAYFYNALAHQLGGREDAYRRTISDWKAAVARGKDPVSNEGLEVLENRRLITELSKNPAALTEELIEKLHLDLQHARPDAAAAAANLPTRLDPALISEAAFESLAASDPAVAAYTQYSGRRLYRELDEIESFDEKEIRWFMDGLDRGDLPGMVALIDRSLQLDPPVRFGSLPLHRELTHAQLVALLELRPELRASEAFVQIYLEKLLPGSETDFERDPKAHADHLQRCRDFIIDLPADVNSLKAHVLHHHLRLQAALGNFPKQDFITYLALPRTRHPLLVQKQDKIAPAVETDANYSNATGCPPIADDTEFIESQLRHYLGSTDSAADFAPFISEKTLNRLHARARLLAGADVNRWGKFLDLSELKTLQEESRITFAPDAPQSLAGDAQVSLPVDFKNTPEVLIRIYQLDLASHLARGEKPIDVSTDLDGLLPHHERRLKFSQPPIQQHRETLALPELAGPGAWIVELVGGPVSARALIYKGRLTPFIEATATGRTVRVFDDRNQQVSGATLRLGSETFTADASGRIFVPDSPNQPLTRGIVVAGPLATAIDLGSRTEQPVLDASFHLDKEQLLADQEAKLRLRVRLTNHGQEIPLDRLKNPALILQAGMLGGIVTERVIAGDLKLAAVQEIPFQVPAGLLNLTLTLRGTITPLTGGEPQSLSRSVNYALNSDLNIARVATAFFSTTSTGHRLEVRGRNGEPLPSRELHLSLKRPGYEASIQTQVRTGADGRVDLGTLDGIETLEVLGNDIDALTVKIPRRELDHPNELHVAAGEEIRLPLASPAAAPDRLRASLLELREDKPLRDHFDKIQIENGQWVIRALPAGDYRFERDDQMTILKVSAGIRVDDLLVSSQRILPHHQPAAPFVASAGVEGGQIVLRIAEGSPATRVSLIGRRYDRGDWPLAGVAPFAPQLPGTAIPGFTGCGYLTEKRLSDDMRYILDRRSLRTFPGSMLPRPGQLLNRWSDEEIKQKDVQGQAGTGGGMSGGLQSPGRSAAPITQALETTLWSSTAVIDFLAAPAVIRFDLTPAADGSITLPLDDFKSCQSIEIVAADRFSKDTRLLPLPANDPPLRDRRIARPLDPQAHYIATRNAAVLKKDAEASIENLLDAEWRAFTTLAEAHQFLYGMVHDDRLRDFAFLADWPDFSEEKKLDLLSRHACHEFHLFLARKDRAFFDRHVKPLLAQKPEPQFIDDLLLGRDLKGYLRPFAWERLNAAEKALLSQALPDFRERIAKELSQRWEAEAPAPDQETRLFTQTLRGSDLATRDSLGLARNDYQEETSEGTARLTEKLRRIVIPRIDFEDATLTEVLDFLRLRAAELDTLESDPSRRGINIVARLPRTPEGAPSDLRIRELRVRNVPLSVALRYVCDQLKLRYRIDDFGVTLVPQTETGEDLFTRTFNVPPDFASGLDDSSVNGAPDPFAPSDGTAARLTARQPISELLRRAGITLPEGASASLGANGQLVVTATPTELEKVGQLTENRGVEEASPTPADPFVAAPAIEERATMTARPRQPVFPERTRLWREANYFKFSGPANEKLIPLNRFWIDLAAWDGKSPFLSPHFNACHRNANEALMCLALLDLPFKAARPGVTVDGTTLRVKASDPMLLFYKDTRRTDKVAPESPLLVRQTFSPADEPYRTINGRRRENPVVGDFRTGLLYRGSVVVTNPTGIGRRIDLLAQIPAGAIPMNGKTATLSITRELEPYGVVQEELYFYFPAAGEFAAYPLQISEEGTILAQSESRSLRVSSEASAGDAASWPVLAAEGTNDQILGRLAHENLRTLDLGLILWRLQEKPFFLAVSRLLRDRLHYSGVVSAYGFKHQDADAMRDYLENSLLAGAVGDWFTSPLLTIRPVTHHDWETLEFDPLINARAHRFGGDSLLTHDQARRHYQAFLNQLGWKAELSANDQLTLTAFLFLQDRIEEAIARFDQIQPDKLSGRLAYDYLQSVVHFYREQPEQARALAAKVLPSLPPGLWHDRFQSVIDQSAEIAALNQPQPDQKPDPEIAAPQLDLQLAGDGKLLLRHHSLKQASLRLFNIDPEVLFTKAPFLAGDGNGSAEPPILPNEVLEIPLIPEQSETTVDLPPAMRQGNVLVAARSGTTELLRVLDSQALELRQNPLERTIQVLDATNSKPLPKTYVKVYAKTHTGEVVFHKDGYTDLRGKFDYLTHTATDPTTIRSLAILVNHPEKGARTVVYDR